MNISGGGAHLWGWLPPVILYRQWNRFSCPRPTNYGIGGVSNSMSVTLEQRVTFKLKSKKIKRQKDTDRRKSLLLWCQGIFAHLPFFCIWYVLYTHVPVHCHLVWSWYLVCLCYYFFAWKTKFIFPIQSIVILCVLGWHIIWMSWDDRQHIMPPTTVWTHCNTECSVQCV